MAKISENSCNVISHELVSCHPDSQVMLDWLYSFFSITPTQADITGQWVAHKNLNHHFDILAKMEAMLEDLNRKGEATDYKNLDMMECARLNRDIGEVSRW